MKKIRQSVMLMICAVLLLVLLPNTAQAATMESGTCGENLTWILDYEGTLIISGTGPMTEFSDGNNVPWCSFRDYVKKVIIEDGVTTIGKQSFFNCYSLTSVTIPDSVTTISRSAFYACYKMTELTIGTGVKTIDKNAFNGCSNLTSVTIPNSVSTIGEAAFWQCTKLNDLTIGSKVKTIGDSAFG